MIYETADVERTPDNKETEPCRIYKTGKLLFDIVIKIQLYSYKHILFHPNTVNRVKELCSIHKENKKISKNCLIRDEYECVYPYI